MLKYKGKRGIEYPKSQINTSKFLREGESIEEKMRRVTQTQEPIDDTSPTIYQERASGVDPSCDPRTDRWDVALDAMDKVAQAEIAKRDSKPENTEQTATGEDVTYITEE